MRILFISAFASDTSVLTGQPKQQWLAEERHVIAQALDRMKQHLEAAQSYLDEGDTQQAQCFAYAAGEDAWEAMQAFPTALNLSPVLAAAFERSWHECERKHLSWVKGIAYEPEVNGAICLTPITV
ncbi:hypothetical protein QCD60_29455 [Pokkaliibacter sp. MBI-7]|uniref:hypothetical protein n=1 Tax=Pokkaliibacter sp. MBI-7 TaxID=3040600 RepID=UPI002447D67A|nr:hypothetical protein [Pokkaliibacter sp. MBI-7]MDH2436644.1 hypothetical protein [Pokkaliibacter sp. MBI-7]